MIQNAYHTILSYALPGVSIFLILLLYKNDLRYWWLRNFTKTHYCSAFKNSFSPPKCGEKYYLGGHEVPDGEYVYVGKNRFKRIA